MAYRNKFYICFDSNNDIHYYWLMRAWKQEDGSKFDLCDSHDLNTFYNDSLEEPIRYRLKEQLQRTKAFVVLIGESTRYLQFVQWEIEEALILDLPIICVNLNGFRHRDIIRCPSIIGERLSVHINFNAVVLQHTLETWPDRHRLLRQQEDSSPYYYKQSDYINLLQGTSAWDSHLGNHAKDEDEFPKEVAL